MYRYNAPNNHPITKRFNPLPRILEEDSEMDSRGVERPPVKPQILHVHKLSWSDDKISAKWLHRLSSTSVSVTSAQRTPSTGIQCSLSSCVEWIKYSECGSLQLPAAHESETPEYLIGADASTTRHQSFSRDAVGFSSKSLQCRKPDSKYIANIEDGANSRAIRLLLQASDTKSLHQRSDSLALKCSGGENFSRSYAMKNISEEPTYGVFPQVAKLSYPLPLVLEADNIADSVYKRSSSTNCKVPRVHKFYWTTDKISLEWLNRINSMTLSIYTSEPTATNNLGKDLETFREESGCGTSVECEGSINTKKSLGLSENDASNNSCHLNPRISEKAWSRKPDSTYISLISSLTYNSLKIPTIERSSTKCFPANSVTRLDVIDGQQSADVTCTSLKELDFQRLCQRLVLSFPESLERKRKNSFEYIQQISSL